jgi:hypothetical protein
MLNNMERVDCGCYLGTCAPEILRASLGGFSRTGTGCRDCRSEGAIANTALSSDTVQSYAFRLRMRREDMAGFTFIPLFT